MKKSGLEFVPRKKMFLKKKMMWTIQQKIRFAFKKWLDSRFMWNRIESSGHKDKLLHLFSRQLADDICVCAANHEFSLAYLPYYE